MVWISTIMCERSVICVTHIAILLPVTSDGPTTCYYMCLNGTCVNTREDCIVPGFPTITNPTIDFPTADGPGSTTCNYICLNGTCVNTREDCSFPTITTPNFDIPTVDSPGYTGPNSSTVGKMYWHIILIIHLKVFACADLLLSK